MKKNHIDLYYRSHNSCAGAGYLRFLLMASVCFWNYGFPEPTGFLVALSGFAAPAFFILSGFFVLKDGREKRMEKTKRKIKRSAYLFGFLFVFYILVNLAFYFLGKLTGGLTLRGVFNFTVLNLWFMPIGSNIWFIQAMLYAYILIYFADRLGLMKYYKLVLPVTAVIMLCTGELAGLLRFNVFGYTYIPGNWLTRALPYILLGMLLREKAGLFIGLQKWIYVLVFFFGSVLTIGEIILLGRAGVLLYEGHMAGYGIMALAACCMALSYPRLKTTRISRYDTALSGFIYMFMDSVFYVVAYLASLISFSFGAFGGIAALLISIAIALLLRKTRLAHLLFSSRRRNRGQGATNGTITANPA